MQVKGQLLRELLVESKAYGYLLGSGGAGGCPKECGVLLGGWEGCLLGSGGA